MALVLILYICTTLIPILGLLTVLLIQENRKRVRIAYNMYILERKLRGRRR